MSYRIMVFRFSMHSLALTPLPLTGRVLHSPLRVVAMVSSLVSALISLVSQEGTSTKDVCGLPSIPPNSPSVMY